jgi:Flp pilus assembly protein CpaB
MKQKNLILMVVAVGCGLVAAFLTTQINAKPKVETIEVYVALKDLPVGTTFIKADLPKLVTKKKVNKDALPPAFVINEEEFYDKRLTRSVMKDETFNPGTLTKGGVITLPEGMDLCTLPLNAGSGVAGFVTPGAKVDVLATLRLNNRLLAFPLLVDMLVLAVDNHVDTTKQQAGTFPNMSSVSFAATQEQALLLALAKQRGCHLELLLRHPGKAPDKDYDIKKVYALLQDEKNPAKSHPTHKGESADPGVEPWVVPITAPDPKEKEEVVKVWVATANIPAGTEITKELVASKLKEKEMPRQYAIGAYSDLSECIKENLTLKTDLVKDAWLTASNVGPSTKVPPPDVFTAPKVGQVTEKPAVRATMDKTVTTASGTYVYRFEEVKPGEWRLKAILTPEEATRTAPRSPAATPDPKKADER